MPWIEFVDQPSLTYSNITGFIGTRVFKVWGNVFREQIVTKPQDVKEYDTPPSGTVNRGLPMFDSDYPYDSTRGVFAKLDQYQISQQSGNLLVTAIYTDIRYRANFTAAFQTERYEIPYARKIVFFTPRPGASPLSQAGSSWTSSSVPMYSTWWRISTVRYWTRPGEFGGSQDMDVVRSLSRSINQQVNQLHDIGGNSDSKLWVRFEGGDVQQQTIDRYRIRYSWVFDTGIRYNAERLRGTVVVPFAPPGSNLKVTDLIAVPRIPSRLYETQFVYNEGTYTTEDQGWIRPPFERVERVPFFGLPPGSTDMPRPVYVGLLDFDNSNPQGWSTLPGMP